MSAWESTRTPSLRKSASCSIIALRNNSESPILSSSATVHSPSVDWSLLKEPHGGRLRQRPLPFTHSRGHYLAQELMLDQNGSIREQIQDALDAGESQKWHLVGVSDVLPERGVILFWDTSKPSFGRTSRR